MHLTRLVSFALVMGLMLTLSACGGKDEKKDEKKEEKKDENKEGGGGGGAAAKKASDKIIGKWNFDSAATLTKMEGTANTEEEKAALEFAKGMMSEMQMSFEFTKDGKMIMGMTAQGESETKEGTYKVKSEDGSSLVIAGTMDGDTKDVKATLLGDDKLELVMPDDEGPGAMVLNRAK